MPTTRKPGEIDPETGQPYPPEDPAAGGLSLDKGAADTADTAPNPANPMVPSVGYVPRAPNPDNPMIPSVGYIPQPQKPAPFTPPPEAPWTPPSGFNPDGSPQVPGPTTEPTPNPEPTPGPTAGPTTTPEPNATPPPNPNTNPSPGQPSIPSVVAPEDFRTTTRRLLMDQMQGLGGPTDETSPDVAPAIGAYSTQSDREQQRNRDAIAERHYAGGTLRSGSFDTDVAAGRERAALDRAMYSGNVVKEAAQSKRENLRQLLQTATSAGLTTEAQQIQQRIAETDAQIRTKSLEQQNAQFTAGQKQQDKQFYSGLNQNDKQFYSGLNQNEKIAVLRAALEARGLDQQDAQYYANLATQKELAGGQLGYLYAQLQAGINRDTLLAALGGR